MASVYSRLGTEVTVVEFFDKICPFLDGDLSGQFQKILAKQGTLQKPYENRNKVPCGPQGDGRCE